MFGGQIRKGSVRIGVELDEYQIPYLDALGAVLIDQRTSGVSLLGEVDVKLRTRTAGARVSHHPEIVLLVPVDDVNLRIQTSGGHDLGPVIVGFLIELGGIALGLIRRIHRGVDPILRELPNPGHQLPGPLDRFPFEVIPKGPVPQHLEECMMIGVPSDVFQIIVFPTRSNAFLGISSPPRLIGTWRLAQKNGHELIHPGIGKEEVRGLRQ